MSVYTVAVSLSVCVCVREKETDQREREVHTVSGCESVQLSFAESG